MIKSPQNWIVTSARHLIMWLAGLTLLLTTFIACVTSSPPPWYKSYGFNSYNEVVEPSSVSVLIKALGDNDENVRYWAAEALGEIGPEAKDAIPALIKALSDNDESVRIKAIYVIGRIGPAAKEAIPALIKAFGDSDYGARTVAGEALKKIGPEAKELVPVLIQALGDSDVNVRIAAAKELGEIRPAAKEAIPALIKAFGDSDWNVLRAVAKALGEMGPAAKEAIPALVQALGSSTNVRWAAAEALEKIAPDAEELVPALIQALGHRNANVRIAAAEALGNIGPEAKEAVPALILSLGDNSALVRWKAAQALGNIGPEAKEAVPALVKALSDSDPEVRKVADSAIAKIGPGSKEAVPALIEALGDNDARVRYGAVKALGKIRPGAESVAPALIAVLSDPEPHMRREAISLLQQIGCTGNDFLESLEKIASKDPNDSVKKLASDALRKIKFAILASGKTAAPVSEKRKPTFLYEALGQRWAVVIGISRYQDTRIPTLRYAYNDAKSFYKWLISPNGGKYAPTNVKLLLNRNASLRNIRDSLFAWLKQALEEDVVTIYFAGHGSPDSPDSPDNLFLLPYDVQYDSIAATSFPMWDIETALKRFIKAKKVIVIADACHAGGVGQSFDIARRANRAIRVNPISTGLQNLSKVGDGVCIISASDDKQFSQESKKWGGGHGVFTYFLLQGLAGEADYNKDNNVSLGELIPYLSQQVRRATRNAQSPVVAGKFDPALSIGR
jgi:HEAT repeat protein